MITTFFANQLLDELNGSEVALYEGDPNGAGTEVTGGSYARQTPTWNAAASKSKSNSADISWTDLPTSAEITHVAIMDTTNVLDVYTLSDTFSPNTNNNELTISAGNLTVTLS